MSGPFTGWGMDMTPQELGRWRRNAIHKFLALPDPFADVHEENKDDEVRLVADDEHEEKKRRRGESRGGQRRT